MVTVLVLGNLRQVKHSERVLIHPKLDPHFLLVSCRLRQPSHSTGAGQKSGAHFHFVSRAQTAKPCNSNVW